jgi:hypothetical protein
MESKEEWISAAAVIALLKAAKVDYFTATESICSRASEGMIRTRAERFVEEGSTNRVRDNFELPREFWSGVLKQNWKIGDFEKWGQTLRLKAFGVSFLYAEIEKMIPTRTPAAPSHPPAQAAEPTRNKGGRPRREFWEELWVEIARQLYVGDLQPKTQADIEGAMHQWISDNGHDAGETVVRDRARMLWRAINKDGN